MLLGLCGYLSALNISVNITVFEFTLTWISSFRNLKVFETNKYTYFTACNRPEKVLSLQRGAPMPWHPYSEEFRIAAKLGFKVRCAYYLDPSSFCFLSLKEYWHQFSKLSLLCHADLLHTETALSKCNARGAWIFYFDYKSVFVRRTYGHRH